MTSSARAWREKYPTVAAYLDRLPHGWSSYPTCEASCQLVRWLGDHGALDPLDGLPPELSDPRRWTRGSWMPEVVYVGTMLAILDATFSGDQNQFLEWATDSSAERMARTEETLNKPPVTVMSLGAELWARYHRGTPATMSVSQTSATFVVEHPTPLFPELLLRYVANGIAVALVRADGAQPRVDVHTDVVASMARTTITASWLDPAGVPHREDGGR